MEHANLITAATNKYMGAVLSMSRYKLAQRWWGVIEFSKLGTNMLYCSTMQQHSEVAYGLLQRRDPHLLSECAAHITTVASAGSSCMQQCPNQTLRHDACLIETSSRTIGPRVPAKSCGLLG